MERVKGLAAAILATALLAAAGAGAPPPAPAEEGKEPLRAAGFLRAEAHLQLAVRRAGLVLSVERLEGDEVGPGEPVVLLDDAEERIQVALARNDVETAEINLAKIRSGPRPEDLERAKAFLAESQAGLDLAERTLRADIELQKGGILSDLSRRRSERMLDAAKAQAEGRRLDLVLLEKGSRPEDVRLAEVEVERQRSRLAQRELEAARARIAGSRDGRAVVTRVWVEEGQWVEAGRVVAELVYMDRLRVELDLPGETVEGLARGAKAAIRSPRHPGAELSGAVTRVSPVLDAASGTIRIVVEADNPGHRFRPGGEAEVEIRR